ncbi:hypothetical protein BCR44DRAFT_1439742 [Catenaria anguillulae PL171]|uniref:Uncharacterized protein n=1 Tax=Catenaria anguillulae PL171 TaxID=765915 RepID=A0A1Y2HDN8_9FUNG|nr:hypothetical protein BCR44DRAFT_1439742 [Catenaria anguillulae PL171]
MAIHDQGRRCLATVLEGDAVGGLKVPRHVEVQLGACNDRHIAQSCQSAIWVERRCPRAHKAYRSPATHASPTSA